MAVGPLERDGPSGGPAGGTPCQGDRASRRAVNGDPGFLASTLGLRSTGQLCRAAYLVAKLPAPTFFARRVSSLGFQGPSVFQNVTDPHRTTQAHAHTYTHTHRCECGRACRNRGFPIRTTVHPASWHFRGNARESSSSTTVRGDQASRNVARRSAIHSATEIRP